MYGSTADLELTPGNSFNIDDLLNFSNEEIAGPIGENDGTHYWAKDRTANSDFLFYGNSFSNADYYFHASDFFVPFDELAEQVERVSNFVVEDSFSMENSKCTPLPSQNLGAGARANLEDAISSSSAVQIPSISCVPARPRSKRSRAARDISSWYSLHNWTTSSSGEEQAEISKMRKRCLHCGIERTPQWRAGPMGPKSLCNACGVRYKSGRLLPEYRPAASPTFTPSIHSNCHKNVLHIRRLKHIAPRS